MPFYAIGTPHHDQPGILMTELSKTLDLVGRLTSGVDASICPCRTADKTAGRDCGSVSLEESEIVLGSRVSENDTWRVESGE